jgi:peptide/nickel transport system permease protein
MLIYVLKRLLFMIPLLIGITFISFLVIVLAPGSPTDLQTQMNPDAGGLALKQFNREYGLDRPLVEQYLNWLIRLLPMKRLDHHLWTVDAVHLFGPTSDDWVAFDTPAFWRHVKSWGYFSFIWDGLEVQLAPLPRFKGLEFGLRYGLDFGRSYKNNRPVLGLIMERLPITLIINVLSLILILLVAIPLGIISATRQNSWLDKGTTVFVFLGFAVPSFWLALLLQTLIVQAKDWLGTPGLVLPISGIESSWPDQIAAAVRYFAQEALGLNVLPVAGLKGVVRSAADGFAFWYRVLDWSRHLVLPVFVSAFGGLAGLSRYMRSSMLEAIRQDYITTARAKGLPERVVIYKHALRNALMPVVTILGLSVPGLIGGSVIMESVFAIPGLGRLFYEGVMNRDYPVVMGGLIIGAVLTLLGNLLADISYALVDPRLRKGRG